MAIIIQRHRIIGTNTVAYSAWEPYADHATMTHIDGVRYGKVGTSRIPPELDRLPAYSDARYTAVHAFIAADKERAYKAIRAAHPEIGGQSDGMGEIEACLSGSHPTERS